MACEILVPAPGIKPTTPAVEAWSVSHWTIRSPRNLCLLKTGRARPHRRPCALQAEALLRQPGVLCSGRREFLDIPLMGRTHGLHPVTRSWKLPSGGLGNDMCPQGEGETIPALGIHRGGPEEIAEVLGLEGPEMPSLLPCSRECPWTSGT